MTKKILDAVKVAAFGGYIIFMTASCKTNDSRIARMVTIAARTVASHVTVNVQNGVVTLGGIVRGTATKSTLDSVVKGVKGVVSVIDNTSFEPPPPPPPSSTPYPISYHDTLVARTIGTAFKAEHISGVKVHVANGVITLTGNAAKKDLRAILLIANESHPRKVVNRITVK